MKYCRNITVKPSYIYIDYSDIKRRYNLQNMEPMVFYIMDTYANTAKPDEDKWKAVCDPINAFFKMISPEDCHVILMSINDIIKEIDVSFKDIHQQHSQYKVVNTMKTIGEMIYQLDQKINLCDQLYKYVDIHIYVGDFSNAGSKAQDRSEVTYKEEDAKEIVTISLLSKLLFPIFGRILNNFSDHIVDENSSRSKKEIYTSIILDRILNERFRVAMGKLRIYVSDYVTRQYNDLKTLMDSTRKTSASGDEAFYSKDSFMYFTAGAFMGITTDSLIDSTIANLLIKAFVNGNTHENEKSHIVNYMHVSVSSNITKQLGERSTTRRIYRRTDPGKSKSPGEQETPQFEIDSVVSDRPCDIGEVIGTEIPSIVQDCILTYNAEELYSSLYKYHKFNHVTPHPINQICLSKFYGEALGGGESILYLTNDSYGKLLSAFQIYLMDMNFDQLLFMSSAKYCSKKISPTDTDIRMENSLKTLDNYNMCKIKFKHCWSVFSKTIEEIQIMLGEYEFCHNLPDIVYDRMKIPNLNGSVVDYSLILMNQILYILKG